MTITTIPPSLLIDASQLVKANSIIGNKKDNLTILYTPASNLHKDGSMDTGSVSFKNDKLVRRTHVIERVNSVVNRLVKTKVVREVDHENEKVERIKEEGRVRRLAANVRVSYLSFSIAFSEREDWSGRIGLTSCVCMRRLTRDELTRSRRIPISSWQDQGNKNQKPSPTITCTMGQ